MNSVFEQLRTATVEPAATRGERGKSLFDFIDAETVQSLQQEALDQAKEYVASVASQHFLSALQG